MVIVFAVTDPDAGKRGISAFIVPTDTPGYEVVRIELGQHASDTCQLAFNDLRIPATLRLGEGGRGLPHRPGQPRRRPHRHRRPGSRHGARGVRGAARDYAHERETFGKPIIEHQAVAFRLADMATRIAVARQMVHHAASLREAGLPCLTEASDGQAVRLGDGRGSLLRGDPDPRWLWLPQGLPGGTHLSGRAGHQIYEGTSDVQRLVIARSL